MSQVNHEGSNILCFLIGFLTNTSGGQGAGGPCVSAIQLWILQFKFNITRLVSQDPF